MVNWCFSVQDGILDSLIQPLDKRELKKKRGGVDGGS